MTGPHQAARVVSEGVGTALLLAAIVGSGIMAERLAAGNSIVLVESSGPHENGFTVLRSLARQLPNGYRTKLPSGEEFWRAIQRPSHLYTPLVQAILEKGIEPTAIENVTGHGWQKIMRSGKALRYRIEKTLPLPELFTFVQQHSKKSLLEMLQIFNCGTGAAIFCATSEDATRCVEIAAEQGLRAVAAGRVEEAAHREVVVEPWNVTLKSGDFALARG